MSATNPALVTQPLMDLLRTAGDHPIMRSFPHGALIVFDRDLRYLAAGGQGLVDVGLSRIMLQGRTIDEVFPPEIVAAIEPLYRAALAGQESETDIPFEGHVYLHRLGPVYDDAGTVIAGMGFTQDVTGMRGAHQALEMSERRLREEHGRLEAAQLVGRVGSWEMDLTTGELSWSDAMLRLYGLVPDLFDGDYASAEGCIHPDDRAAVDAATQACLATGSDLAFHYRITRWNDGATRWFTARAKTMYDGDLPARLVGAVADVTEQVQAEHQAREAQSFYNAVLAASPDLTIITELDSRRTLYASREEGSLGRSTQQLAALEREGRMELVHPDDRHDLLEAAQAVQQLGEGEVVRLRFRALHADGEWHWLSRHTTPFRFDGTGRVTEVLQVIRDVTDVVQAEERLTHAALHDALTGLPNRRLLIVRLDEAMADAQRREREVAVLFCDLDGFKCVNDAFGHATGDGVLVEVAQRISRVLRPGDTVARVGGDEFVVVIQPWNRRSKGGLDTDVRVREGASGEQVSDRELAQRVADRITGALRQPIALDGVEHVVTVSIGMAGTNAAATSLTAEQIVQNADTAMYEAKKLGKDRAAHGL